MVVCDGFDSRGDLVIGSNRSSDGSHSVHVFDPDPIGAIHGIQGLEKESAMSLEATSVDLMALVRKTWIGSMNPLRMFLLALS